MAEYRKFYSDDIKKKRLLATPSDDYLDALSVLVSVTASGNELKNPILREKDHRFLTATDEVAIKFMKQNLGNGQVAIKKFSDALEQSLKIKTFDKAENKAVLDAYKLIHQERIAAIIGKITFMDLDLNHRHSSDQPAG